MWKVISVVIWAFTGSRAAIISTTRVGNHSSECTPIYGDCSFYANCLESKFQCGKDGYALGYGHKYCQSFGKFSSMFSPRGQKWIWKTMMCLQKQLIPIAQSSTKTSCPSIRKQAFESHLNCYTQTAPNICALTPMDLGWISYIVREELAQPYIPKFLTDVADYCIPYYVRQSRKLFDSLINASKAASGNIDNGSFFSSVEFSDFGNTTFLFGNGTENGLSNNGTQSQNNEADQVYAISNAVSIVFIIIVVLVIFFWRRYQRNRKKLKKLTKEEVSKFLEGDNTNLDPSVDPDCNLPFSIPYDRNFEIDLKDVDIERASLLGSGAYGVVYKGIIKSTRIPVAVKTTKPNPDLMYFKSLLSELKVMTFIGDHENIIKCIGACTAELTSRKLYIFVEFCALGSMEFYLREHREDFKHLTNKPQFNCEYQNLRKEPEPDLEKGDEDLKKKPHAKYVNLTRNGESADKLNVVDLMRFSYEISNAMEYLSTKKVVHGDLATRNVLLTENRLVKVTDFGLSRQMMNYSTYVKTASKHNPLPWRWLALETMKDSTFSTKSDVWAFGITLWEIFSLAQVPYPGLAYSQDFLRMLEKGLRMSSPSDFTPPEIYKIMIESWHERAEERPTFKELKDKLLDLVLEYGTKEE